jgi:hypothetical protein
MNKHPFKCEICGKFIGYKEIDNDEIIIEYTPDTEFTHKKCRKWILTTLKN